MFKIIQNFQIKLNLSIFALCLIYCPIFSLLLYLVATGLRTIQFLFCLEPAKLRSRQWWTLTLMHTAGHGSGHGSGSGTDQDEHWLKNRPLLWPGWFCLVAWERLLMTIFTVAFQALDATPHTKYVGGLPVLMVNLNNCLLHVHSPSLNYLRYVVSWYQLLVTRNWNKNRVCRQQLAACLRQMTSKVENNRMFGNRRQERQICTKQKFNLQMERHYILQRK
jgi:hypothetical protein